MLPGVGHLDLDLEYFVLIHVFLSYWNWRWIEDSCEHSGFGTKIQRTFMWLPGESTRDFFPVPAKLQLFSPPQQARSAVACNWVPGYAVAVQNDSWFCNTGLSEPVNTFPLFSRGLQILLFRYLVCVSWGGIAEAQGSHCPFRKPVFLKMLWLLWSQA